MTAEEEEKEEEEYGGEVSDRRGGGLVTLTEGILRQLEEEQEADDGVNGASGAGPQPVSRQARLRFIRGRFRALAEGATELVTPPVADSVDAVRGGCVADLNLFRGLPPPSPACSSPSTLRLRVEKGYPGRSE